MDYCHPCHRHLNGALACPGCGAPAYAVAPFSGYEGVEAYEAERKVPEPGPSPEWEPEPEPEPEWESRGDSRRDRKAAAHRRRRRRALLATAGFVLAAGGLSLAELGIDAPGSSPEPAAAGEETPDGGGTELRPRKSPAGATVKSPRTSGSVTPSESEEPKEPKEKKPETESESPEPTTPPPAEPTTTAPPPQPPPSPKPDPPKRNPPKEDPDPAPTPTETCNRFLWWCT